MPIKPFFTSCMPLSRIFSVPLQHETKYTIKQQKI